VWESRYEYTHLTFDTRWKSVSGPRRLTPGEGTHATQSPGGRLGHRAGLEKSLTMLGIVPQFSVRPAHDQVNVLYKKPVYNEM
jgi:hypothetical protein